MTFNDKCHPECREGEMFLTNSNKEGFRRIGYATKRMGDVAYDRDGEMITPANELWPVFVMKTDYAEEVLS